MPGSVPTRRDPKHKVARRFGFDVYGIGGAKLARRLDRKPAKMFAVVEDLAVARPVPMNESLITPFYWR